MIAALEQERQQNAFWLAEKKERELKKIQQGETLKRNTEQLMMKKNKDMAEREKDMAEVKKVSCCIVSESVVVLGGVPSCSTF